MSPEEQYGDDHIELLSKEAKVMSNPNVFHYRKGWLHFYANQYDTEGSHRITFNFNILKRIGLGVKGSLAPYGFDWELDILCFNLNGMFFWGGRG